MRKQLFAYTALGLIAYLLFLIATFPADRALALLRPQLPQLQAAGVSGTVWSGRAAVIQYQGQRLARFTWQFQPLALLRGRAGFAIAFEGEGRSGSADVAITPGGTVTADALKARLPMAELSSLLQLPVELGGALDADLQRLEISGGRITRADGQLVLRNAAVTSPVAQPLGAFSAQLSSEDAGVRAQIRDEGGPLQLEGTLRLINDGSYQFSARASVRDPQQTMLKQVLSMAGRQEPDGRVALEYNGHL